MLIAFSCSSLIWKAWHATADQFSFGNRSISFARSGGTLMLFVIRCAITLLVCSARSSPPPCSQGPPSTKFYRLRLRTVRVALFVTPPAVAETVTVVLAAPADVVTTNVAELLPAGTVTLAGTLATVGLPLDSVTTFPPAGALPLSVTVPVEELPAFTVEGESANDDATGGLRVTAVVLVMPV